MDAKQLIDEIVKNQQVTRYKIAQDLKVMPSTVYKWHSGKKAPNGAHMIELLRRAGRLAAVVMLGAVVGVISAPQEANASALQTKSNQPLCIMSNRIIGRVTKAIVRWAIRLLRFPALQKQ